MSEKNRNILVTSVIILFCVLGLYIFITSKNSHSVTKTDTPRSITVEGTLDCLPAKDGIDQAPSICVFGLKTDTDVYYGLNLPDNDIVDEINSRYRVDGMLYPNSSNEDIWEQDGTIEVDTIVKID